MNFSLRCTRFGPSTNKDLDVVAFVIAPANTGAAILVVGVFK